MVISCNTLPEITWLTTVDFASKNEVALFRIRISENQSFIPQLLALLRPDELLRAKRYHRETDQQRFIVARAALRILLGNYSSRPPTDIRFVNGVNHKPLLQNEPNVHYNVSHSKDWILIAVSPAEIGVDVEGIDPLFPFRDVLLHSFSLPERAAIERSNASLHLFYQLWTRKEALVKATARGIDAEFSTIPALDGQHQLNDAAGYSAPWVVSSFAVDAGYVGAVAYQPAPAVALRLYSLGTSLFSGQ